MVTKEAFCPFNRIRHHMGYFNQDLTYQCGIDGGLARGAQRSYKYAGHSVDPCRIEYAKTCPLYQLENKET